MIVIDTGYDITLAKTWIMKKDKSVANNMLLPSEPHHQCGEHSLRCYWKDLVIAKIQCREWEKCNMLKESDKELPTVSGIPIFWAVKSSSTPIDIQDSKGENIWMLEKTGIAIFIYLSLSYYRELYIYNMLHIY